MHLIFFSAVGGVFCLFFELFWERLKPGSEAELEEIEAEIRCNLEKVNWLPGFYSLPPDIQIANSKAYKDGKVRNIAIIWILMVTF